MIKEAISKAMNKENLTREEALQVMKEIISNRTILTCHILIMHLAVFVCTTFCSFGIMCMHTQSHRQFRFRTAMTRARLPLPLPFHI